MRKTTNSPSTSAVMRSEIILVMSSASAPAGIAQRRVDPVDVRLHGRARPFVHDFASPRLANVGLRVARRRQVAPDAVDTFAQDDLYPGRALFQHDDFEHLPAFCRTYLDFFVVHSQVCQRGGDWVAATSRALSHHRTLARPRPPPPYFRRERT